LKTGVAVRGTLNAPGDVDESWTVELAFPWKVLAEHANRPAPPADGDQWRVNFSRVEWLHEVLDGQYKKVPKTPEDNWVWSPQGVIDMHRPERWGYLQFSTAKPGQAKFRPDPDWSAREALYRAYYAQRDHFKKNGVFAPTARDLGLKQLESRLEVQATRRGFEVSWLDRDAKPPKPLYTITGDGLIRKQ
ncbi:MAG TPA: carbohydrate-binding family 9-like protein, partial [Gemmata sp.]